LIFRHQFFPYSHDILLYSSYIVTLYYVGCSVRFRLDNTLSFPGDAVTPIPLHIITTEDPAEDVFDSLQ